jgi:hypothetical protein
MIVISVCPYFLEEIPWMVLSVKRTSSLVCCTDMSHKSRVIHYLPMAGIVLHNYTMGAMKKAR